MQTHFCLEGWQVADFSRFWVACQFIASTKTLNMEPENDAFKDWNHASSRGHLSGSMLFLFGGRCAPWKINSWNLQIIHEKKGTWSEPNLQWIIFQPLTFRGVDDKNTEIRKIYDFNPPCPPFRRMSDVSLKNRGILGDWGWRKKTHSMDATSCILGGASRKGR